MNIEETLKTALDVVQNSRQNLYGPPKVTLNITAQLWNVYLKRKVRSKVIIDPHDVALMNVLQKVARDCAGQHNPDTFVDIAAYAAIAGDLQDQLK